MVHVPLKRAIQREIETPLAKRILGGEVRNGQTVLLDTDPSGSGLLFTLVAVNEPVEAGATR